VKIITRLSSRISSTRGKLSGTNPIAAFVQHAFSEQLPEHAYLAGAQRRANGEFTRALHGTGQRQIGHVHASNQQHKKYRREQYQQIRPHIADDFVLQ
jgi:hypothetical protein